MILHFTMFDKDSRDEADSACVDAVGVDQHTLDGFFYETILRVRNARNKPENGPFFNLLSATGVARTFPTIRGGIKANYLKVRNVLLNFIVAHRVRATFEEGNRNFPAKRKAGSRTYGQSSYINKYL